MRTCWRRRGGSVSGSLSMKPTKKIRGDEASAKPSAVPRSEPALRYRVSRIAVATATATAPRGRWRVRNRMSAAAIATSGSRGGVPTHQVAVVSPNTPATKTPVAAGLNR